MKSPRTGRLISPIGFVVLAMLLSLAYLVADAAGWRQHTTVISGTLPVAGGLYGREAFCGVVYAALYFAFVLLVPVLLIAATLFFLLQRRSFPPR